MKILLISLPSIHAIRWFQNMDGKNELYWFDITDKGTIAIRSDIDQITGWSKRKLPYVKGEYTLSKKCPKMYQSIRAFLEVTESEMLSKIIRDLKPDIIHSFEMQTCSYPLISAMSKESDIVWIYSCWGSDLYHYKQFPDHKRKIKQVLSRVNLIHVDNDRDIKIAKELGYRGNFVKIPGGGGFILPKLLLPKIEDRNVILIKGYEHTMGRALNIIKALETISLPKGIEVVVFGAHQIVIDYILKKNLNFTVYDRHGLSHNEVMKYMSKSMIYCGNSISDGIPNTLLEAICAGAFPIQSNPGGVTEEFIEHGVNGFLIEDCNDIGQIANLISTALENDSLRNNAELVNRNIAKQRLDYHLIQKRINTVYEPYS